MKNKLCRRAGRLRARSVSPRPIDLRAEAPPAPPVAEQVETPAPLPAMDDIPTFVQNVEAYLEHLFK